MYPKKITEAMKDRIRDVGRKRAQVRALRQQAAMLRRGLPTSKQLAYEAGVCVRRVQEIIHESAKSVVSRGT